MQETTFKVSENLISDKQEISEEFCKYFSKIGPKYAEKIPPRHTTYDAFMKYQNPNSIFFSPTDTHEVTRIIGQMKNKNSIGNDNLSSTLLKKLQNAIAMPLSLLVNRSITEGVFPDYLKIAKVIPIFKSGEIDNIENYRPISVLPAISKIFEKVIYNRLFTFLEKNQILHENQYGFRPNRSTIDAIIHFSETIQESMDNNQYSLGLFFDLSKAFDTLDHHILKQKLEWYGIRGCALQWLSNYLSSRKM